MALNVLIVDDSTVMRCILAKTLRLAGIALGSVYEAADGQKGLDRLSQGGIDLVLADINMPVMSGMEMFEQSRRNPQTAKLPFVFVSSDSSSARVQSVLDQGAGFVHKPLSPEALLETITSVIGGTA